MEVDESSAPAGAGVTDEDLLFADDGDAVVAEYTSGEVDQLLGEDDEETTKLFAEEGIDLHAEGEGTEPEEHSEEHGQEDHGEEDHGEGEEEGEGGDGSHYGYRGRGMRRPFFRGMRGGRFMMRGMRGMMMMMGPPR